MEDDAMPAKPSGHEPALAPWRERLHEIIFEADTPAGKAFDVALLVAILVSVVAVMLDSVPEIHQRSGAWLSGLEIALTAGFTIEYVLRLVCVRRPARYAVSFFGIVDLVAVLPTYLDIVIEGEAHSLIVIRALRLLRAFRILKLGHLLSEATLLRRAIVQSRAKIAVFLSAILVVVTIMGAAMYLVESGTNSGFVSIPQSCYWAIVTMTTVGYGDIAPMTAVGKALAAVVMVLGYSFIIVPTGIISTELARAAPSISTQACPSCAAEGHDPDAKHCKFCGAKL